MNYSKIDSHARIADLSGSANEMVNFLSEEDLTAYPEYAPMVDKLSELNKALITASNKDKARSELAELDVNRNKRLSAIRISIQSALLADEEEIVQHAQRIWTIFNKYGYKISKLSYAAESANIQSLLEELSQTDLQTAIAAIPFLRSHLTALATAQAEFETSELEYDELSAMLKNKSSASALKPQLLEAIGTIVNYHNAVCAYKDAHFTELANVIEHIISELNSITKQCSKKSKKTAPPTESQPEALAGDNGA